jgi:hypothetical protein
MTRFGPVLLLVLGALACNGGEAPPVRPAGKSSRAVSPGPKPEPASIELRRGRNPQEVVLIRRGGALVGPAGGSLHRILFSSRDRAADLRFFVRRYAPFRMPVPGGELVFRGRGRALAGPVERRMIAEWARLVAAEAGGGSGSAAYGLILAWHRGGSVGICDDVSVYLTGEVRASSCSWGEEVRGRLTPEALASVYDAFERLAPFQTGGGEADLAGGTESRLIFAGRGKVEAGEAEVAEIQALVPALFRELAARRPAAPAAPPQPAEGTPEKPAGPPPPVPPRLLLPPDRPAGPTGPKPGTEVALEFPEEPPPVPVAPSPRPSPEPSQAPPPGEGASRPPGSAGVPPAD